MLQLLSFAEFESQAWALGLSKHFLLDRRNESYLSLAIISREGATYAAEAFIVEKQRHVRCLRRERANVLLQAYGQESEGDRFTRLNNGIYDHCPEDQTKQCRQERVGQSRLPEEEVESTQG